MTTEEKINLELQNELTELHRIIKSLTTENTRLREALEKIHQLIIRNKPSYVINDIINSTINKALNP